MLTDFNAANPFVNAKGMIKQQSFFKRLALNYAYGKLKNPNESAAKNYRKYLGSYVATSIKRYLPDFVEPTYTETIDDVRTGHYITLSADEDYYRQFPQNGDNVFINHVHPPYLYLLNKLSMDGKTLATATVSGTWELAHVSGSEAAFAELYAAKKLLLKIDENTKKLAAI